MKKTKIIYWIVTIIFAALMLFSAVPDAMNVPDAVKFMNMLGYPPYFTPFIGIMKILGIIAILIPGFPTIKEWAYAGLSYDLLGAIYSIISIGTPFKDWVLMLVWVVFLIASYVYYHKKMKEEKATNA